VKKHILVPGIDDIVSNTVQAFIVHLKRNIVHAAFARMYSESPDGTTTIMNRDNPDETRPV